MINLFKSDYNSLLKLLELNHVNQHSRYFVMFHLKHFMWHILLTLLPSQYKATGKEVFDKVTNTMGLRETWYFGLQSTKTTAGQMWIIDEKRIVDQVYISDDNKPVQLNLLVKFYPQVLILYRWGGGGAYRYY